MKQYAVIPVAKVKAGDVLIADGGFTCLRDQQECTVKQDGGGLYVECDGPDEPEDMVRDGLCNHYLDSQLSDDGNSFVGFWKKT